MPVTYNSFNLALSLLILVVSSDEEFMTTKTVEEFGPYEDFDPYEDFYLGFLFFMGGVMMTFT